MTSTSTPVPPNLMINRVFGDRYRVEELIGIGATSAVYTAYDPVEGRWVALKVFDAALAADERFVERLLEAAEHAAVLAHPNIAEIYDWGNDDGPYIVSELCEGGSLETMLRRGDQLASSQALIMTLECARALHYGHDQGFVHGNIKPSNLVFSPDQHVRITDYGLADVLATAPGSQSARALENVRYASPEQARGRDIVDATDMYSLALVVNESVSGEPPKITDTVVGTLMERAESNADLDASLEGLLPALERCGRVDPAERPEAEELTIALLAAAETMERPAEFPLGGLTTPTSHDEATLLVAGGQPLDEENHVDFDERVSTGEPTHIEEPARVEQSVVGAEETGEFDVSLLGELEDTAAFAGEDSDTAPTNPAEQDWEDEDWAAQDQAPVLEVVTDGPAPGALENLDVAEPVFAKSEEVEDTDGTANQLDVPTRAPSARSTAAAYQEYEDDADDRLPWWPLVALALLVAAAVAAAGYFFIVDSGDEVATVPDLVGMPFDDVALEISSQGWELERLEGRVDGSVIGDVVVQSPQAGTELARGESLTVTVSLGNEMVEIPSDIVGLTVDQASSRLGVVGLAVGRLVEENNEGFDAGLVIGVNEPTTQKPMGQGVSLRVSSGPDDRFVPPEIVGMTIGDATAVLVGLRLQAEEESVFTADAEAGVVLGVIPDVGSMVPADSTVTVIVSAGPEPVLMPDIIGLALDEAIDVLEELGLIFVDVQEGTPGEDVIGSLPPIGARVDVGTEVFIFLDEDDEDGN